MLLRNLILFLWVGVFLSGTASSKDPEPDLQNLVAEAQRTCSPFKGHKLTLAIPVKPGGGYDLMGRAFGPFLSTYSGMSVAVANVTGGSGLQAIKAVANSTSSRPMIGLVNLGSFTTQMAEGRMTVGFHEVQGLGMMATDQTVWITREKIDWLKPPGKELLGASPSSPYTRLGIPAELLGIDIKPLFGYQGTNEAWMALLRGELDVAPMSDVSAKRYLATGTKAVAALTLTDRAHKDFPGVPYLTGEGGLLDIQSRHLAPAQRQRLMALGDLAVVLTEHARALIASRKLNPQLSACLQSATQAALFTPGLAEVAKSQRFELDPVGIKDTQAKIKRVEATLNQHRAYLQATASRIKEAR